MVLLSNGSKVREFEDLTKPIFDLYGDSLAVQIMVEGTSSGKLTGGNLSLICSMMGSPYEIETAGKILFIEDVGEAPYRIDRYLSELKLAGKLAVVNGIILPKKKPLIAGKNKTSNIKISKYLERVLFSQFKYFY